MNEISYVLSTWAILVAMVSLLVSFQLWRKTNRPVVSAAVVTHSGGNIAILYNLIVYNSGNRPATNTRLRADFEILNQCFDQNAATLNIERIKDWFREIAEIPLILNGKHTSSGFGMTGKHESTWIPYSRIPIEIEYFDLEGRRYRSKQILKIKDTDTFEIQLFGKSTQWNLVENKMKIKYFQDTDTALVELSDKVVSETREITENIYVDLDAEGNLVSMTIEHAKEGANLPQFSYEEVTGKSV